MKNPTEWNSLSEKKDVEMIKSSLSQLMMQQRTANIRIYISIFLTVVSTSIFSLVLQTYQTENLIYTILVFSIVLIVIAVIPYYSLILKKLQNLRNPKIDENSNIIDTFDNQTIYYIMMARSYLYEKSKTKETNTQKMYTVESVYYIKKAIFQFKSLTAMMFDHEKNININEEKDKKSKQNKKISYDRINIAVDIIFDCIEQIGNIDLKDYVVDQLRSIFGLFHEKENLLFYSKYLI